MKKMTFLALCFVLLAPFKAMADDGVYDDSIPVVTNQISPVPLTAISIDVLSELKVDVTTVTASNPAVPSIDGFWVVFSGPQWTKAIVTIASSATGLLEKSITLTYTHAAPGAVGTFYAPFSISDWTGSAAGTGTATVTFYNGSLLLGGANHTFILHHN